MTHSKRYSPEIRERAVQLVFEHESEYASHWEAIRSITGKIGCTTETLRTRGRYWPSRRPNSALL
jgi:transposase